jgi:hypothetical protein
MAMIENFRSSIVLFVFFINPVPVSCACACWATLNFDSNCKTIKNNWTLFSCLCNLVLSEFIRSILLLYLLMFQVHFNKPGRSNATTNRSCDHSSPKWKNNAICCLTTRVSYLTSTWTKPIEYINNRSVLWGSYQMPWAFSSLGGEELRVHCAGLLPRPLWMAVAVKCALLWIV